MASVLAGSNRWATRESVRVAYWTGLVVVLALLALAVDPQARFGDGSLAGRLLLALFGFSLVVAAANAARGGGLAASVANPVAVVLAAVLVAVHGVLSGATAPDLSPVGLLVLDAGAVAGAAVAGLVAHGVGAVVRWLSNAVGA